MRPPNANWSGRAVQEARRYMARVTRWPAVCGQGCGVPVSLNEPWVVGHIKSRYAYPELANDPANWRVEHRRCSDKSGKAAVAEKVRRDLGMDPLFSLPDDMTEALALPVSLPPTPPETDFEIPTELTWTYLVDHAPDWLAPYLEMDQFSSPPLVVGPVHPDAVGSYGPDAIAWIEDVEGKTLRWWQRLGIVLKLQHDSAGQLLKRTVVETGPRRAGKSVGLRGQCTWRMDHGAALFGERQEIIHTGSDIAVCRKAQSEVWPWARRVGWRVIEANGKEEVATPTNDKWLVRAGPATYGWDTTFGVVDEGWKVDPMTVNQGLAPSLIGRRSPQLLLTSTSHTEATSLMRTYLADALTGTNPAVLVLWWGARPSDDPSDPAVWRAASPYWDEDRYALYADAYAKAAAGEDSPEFDDPDPMRGFQSQYLNVWRLNERRTPGTPVITATDWYDLVSPLPDSPPTSVAVEGWYDGVSVARAWDSEGGPVIVHTTSYADVPEAADAITGWNVKRPILVSADLVDHATWKDHHLRVTKKTATVVTSVGQLIRSLAESRFRHTADQDLTDQVLTLRTTPAPSGPRIRSTGRLDAVKAAMWAIQDVSTRRKVTLPSRHTTRRTSPDT